MLTVPTNDIKVEELFKINIVIHPLITSKYFFPLSSINVSSCIAADSIQILSVD